MCVLWFDSFLRGRKHRTVVGGELSDDDELTRGVLQGSPLGPLLFIIYINDIVNHFIDDDVFCKLK